MDIKISVPFRPRFVMVFDVETTGLLPKPPKSSAFIPIDKFPHIIQLSFCVYDLWETRVSETFDTYVNIDEKIQIPAEITQLTGATREICNNGQPIFDVLNIFYQEYSKCDIVVAHNIEFDAKMILVEIERNRLILNGRLPECFVLFNPMFETTYNKERFCTMKKASSMSLFETKKYPKLAELFAKLFPEAELPKNLHNSMVDTLICLKCYLKMRHNIEFINI